MAGVYAYVTCDYGNRMIVVDVSDPYDLTRAGLLYTPSDCRGVDVLGDYAYLVEYGQFVAGL